MVLNKKAISPIMATVLLLTVAVVVIVGLQSWHDSYQDELMEKGNPHVLDFCNIFVYNNSHDVLELPFIYGGCSEIQESCFKSDICYWTQEKQGEKNIGFCNCKLEGLENTIKPKLVIYYAMSEHGMDMITNWENERYFYGETIDLDTDVSYNFVDNTCKVTSYKNVECVLINIALININ